MSIYLGWFLLGMVALLVIALAVAWLRSGTLAGPPRIAPAPGALRRLTMVTLLGLATWILIPSFFAAALQVQRDAPLDPVPATRPAPVFTPQQSVIMSLVAGAGAAVVLILASAMFRPGGLRELGFGSERLRRGISIGVRIAILVVPLTLMVAVATDKLWQLVGLEHPGAHEMLQILGETEAPAMRALIYVSAILIAPLFEELLFRGHMQTLIVGMSGPQAASSRAVRWIAILITSSLFTLVHGALWMMPPIFFFSVCLGYVYERTANLWTAITVHLLFNLTNVVLFVHVAMVASR